jgi:hypothetical protein
MVEVTFNFNGLHCIHQYDGGSHRALHLDRFLYVDASTLTSQGDFVATMNSAISADGSFSGGSGQEGTIHSETLGRARILLDDTGRRPPSAPFTRFWKKTEPQTL